mmetsp:Transcript_91127/g.283955  ORF Transcript_91127/g.283955 Transcript_91127/m.283955 type:complete len:227 (-) Transcript_91127:6-686(-)
MGLHQARTGSPLLPGHVALLQQSSSVRVAPESKLHAVRRVGDRQPSADQVGLVRGILVPSARLEHVQSAEGAPDGRAEERGAGCPHGAAEEGAQRAVPEEHARGAVPEVWPSDVRRFRLHVLLQEGLQLPEDLPVLDESPDEEHAVAAERLHLLAAQPLPRQPQEPLSNSGRLRDHRPQDRQVPEQLGCGEQQQKAQQGATKQAQAPQLLHRAMGLEGGRAHATLA